MRCCKLKIVNGPRGLSYTWCRKMLKFSAYNFVQSETYIGVGNSPLSAFLLELQNYIKIKHSLKWKKIY